MVNGVRVRFVLFDDSNVSHKLHSSHGRYTVEAIDVMYERRCVAMCSTHDHCTGRRRDTSTLSHINICLGPTRVGGVLTDLRCASLVAYPRGVVLTVRGSSCRCRKRATEYLHIMILKKCCHAYMTDRFELYYDIIAYYNIVFFKPEKRVCHTKK